MSDEGWTSRVYALLTDAEGHVLVLGSGESRTLPYLEVEGYADDEIPRVRDAVASVVGSSAVVVRPVARTIHEDDRVLEIAFELELWGPATGLPADAAWLGREELSRFDLPTHDRELVDALFADRPPPERPPWAHRGWFAEAADWIESTLVGLGRRPSGPVEQISHWCISSILRTSTADGDVYFKATARSPLFGDEGAVTDRLAGLFPENVPRPLAIDRERRWMLLDDFGPLVGWKAALETRVEVLSLFGQMQLETAGMEDDLGLEDAEIAQLDALVPMLVESCARLAAGPVPDTLVHGDLHLGNVAGGDGRFVFFDWTDACVTHPFLDMLVILFEEDVAARQALRDAYLSVWAAFAPRDDLLELWRVAEPLASLNQAVSYRSILESVERGTGEELGSMLPYWLRKALAAAPHTSIAGH